MPLIANTDLPSFKRLASESGIVTPRAADHNLRELHIGLLNMMPDKALEHGDRRRRTAGGEIAQPRRPAAAPPLKATPPCR